MTSEAKQHKNAKGIWVPCTATKRACRYGNVVDSHRVAPPVVPVTVPLVPTIVHTVEEEDDQKWRMLPSDLEYVDRKLASLNRRLERAGVDEKFTYTKEFYVKVDPETGFEHEFVKILLNTPTLKHNGWSFVARVDEVGDGDNFIISGIGGASSDVASHLEVKSNFCDHCGKVRHRNNTYIIKNGEGSYKQIGSNCMRGFLGVTPSFWALDPEYVYNSIAPDDSDGEPVFGQDTARIPTKYAIQLALAASEDGQTYAGSQHEFSTKDKVMTLMFGEKTRKRDLAAQYSTSDPKWEQKAEQLLKEIKFTGNSDYERNMQTLLKQDHISPKHLGYVVSSVIVLNKQRNVQRLAKTVKTPVKGYLGVKGDRVNHLPVKVTSIKRIQIAGYSYYAPDQTMNIITFETNDGKQVKWMSAAESSDGYKEGDFLIMEKAIIKATEVNKYSSDEETLVKNVKLLK